jgi:hypothetical protein
MRGTILFSKESFLAMMLVRMEQIPTNDAEAVWTEITAMEHKRNSAATGIIMLDTKLSIVDKIGMSRVELTNLRDALNDYLDTLRDKYLALGNPENRVILINRENFQEAVAAIGRGMSMKKTDERPKVTYRSMA